MPNLAVPELNSREPQAPVKTALAVRITTLPEVDTEPAPDVSVIEQPVPPVAFESPARNVIAPPVVDCDVPDCTTTLPPVVPEPTMRLMLPDLPPVARPVDNIIPPVLPFAAPPV